MGQTTNDLMKYYFQQIVDMIEANHVNAAKNISKSAIELLEKNKADTLECSLNNIQKEFFRVIKKGEGENDSRNHNRGIVSRLWNHS